MELLISLRIGIQRARKIGNGSTPFEVPKYFFSSTGNDANDGLSEATPKQTLTALNALSLEPGDFVGLKCGDSFEGTITIGQSGTSGNPITLTSYGTGEKPKIYGSEVITGWTLHEGNIWKATFASTPVQLFVNNTLITSARYPNTGWLENTSASTTTQIISTNLATEADDYYNGANVVIALYDFRLNTRIVSDYTGSTLTLSTALDYAPRISPSPDRFYLTNKLEFLTQPGEWYYDDATNTVYLWKLDSTEPTDTEVRCSVIDNGILISDKDYVTVKNIELNHFNEAAIDAYHANNNNITIDNVTVNHADRYGLKLRGTAHTLTNNTINSVNVNPIYSLSTFSEIIDNTVLNTGEVSNISYRGSIGLRTSAIWSTGESCVIRHNRIDAAIYVGIEWEGINVTIDKNYITNTAKEMADGGGIYTYELSSESQEVIGSQVTNNIILNHGGLSSIYLDNNTEGVTVENNTIGYVTGGNGYGIFVNIVGTNNTVRNNTLFNTTGLRVNSGGSGNVFENNVVVNDVDAYYTVFAPTLALAGSSYISTAVSSWDNNTYIDRHHTSNRLFNDVSVGTVTFATWQSSMGIDANSTLTQTALNANETEKLFYNPTKLVQRYYLNNSSVVFNDVTEEEITSAYFDLQPFTSIILRGLDLNYISTTQYETDAPVVEAFTIEETSGGLVDILSFTVSGNPTKYLLTESATTPLRSAAWTDTVPTVYFTSTEGALTLYAWCMDEYGNISASVSDNTTISALATIGTTTIGGLTTTTANTMRANSFTMPEDGYLVSMVVYHNSSTAAVTMGVYSDNAGSPNALIASTPSTEINDDTGWQEIPLTEPVFVASGSVIWLAYNKSGTNGNFYVATGTGLPRAYKTQTYGTPSLTNIFVDPTLDTGGNYSVYVKYVK